MAYQEPDFAGFGEPSPNGGYVGAYLGPGNAPRRTGQDLRRIPPHGRPGDDDTDADFQPLAAAGVEVVEEPTNCGGLRIATLKDPEGNIVQLLQPVL